jgi:hypothetical protein
MSVKDYITKTKTDKNEKHNHSGHMKMMAICCGVPIIGLLLISYFGIVNTSLETILLLICPIGMVAMMVMMRKKEHGHSHDKSHSCCHTSSAEQEPDNASEESNIQDELIPQTEPSVKNMPVKSCCQQKSD